MSLRVKDAIIAAGRAPDKKRHNRRVFSRMLKKGFPALFQLGTSRSEFATASEHQSLGVIDVRASHPWLALTGRFSTAC